MSYLDDFMPAKKTKLSVGTDKNSFDSFKSSCHEYELNAGNEVGSSGTYNASSGSYLTDNKALTVDVERRIQVEN